MTDEPRPEGSTENPPTQSPAAGPETAAFAPEPAPSSEDHPAAAPEAAAPEAAAATLPSPAQAEEETEGNGEESGKLHQTVEISDVGPCKKHIKVTVQRQDIDNRLGEKFKELM